MSGSIELKARAKINISLDILRKRPDGYHEMQMIMQTLELYDTLNMEIIKNDNSVVIQTNSDKLSNTKENLIYKAVDTVRKEYNIENGVKIKLEKRIPISAGLAGGSADCAAAIIGMNRLFNLNMSDEKLAVIGKSLGADVPFCLRGGTMLAEGIGEILTPLDSLPQTKVLLVKPPIDVSTASIFKNYDPEAVEKHPNTKKLIEYIKKQDIKSIAKEMRNVLETVTVKKYPVIAEIKKIMNKNNAFGCLMSGSGPSVFGFFEEENDIRNAFDEISDKLEAKECFITKFS